MAKIRDEARVLREKGPEPEALPDRRRLRALRRAHRRAGPDAAVLGRAARSTSTWTRSTATSTPTCSSSCTGAGAASRARPGRSSSRTTSCRAWSACGASRTTCSPRALLGYFPAASVGNAVEVYDPEDHDTRARDASSSRASPSHDRLCIADFYRPKDSGERDVVAFQAVTAGSRGHRPDGRAREATASSPSSSSSTASACRSPRAWPSGCTGASARDSGIPATQGRRWAWGYPACPEQSEHEKLFRLLGAESIGLSLVGGHAVEPEQSTVAIVTHHPQAVYFGMKSGRLLPPEKSARRGHPRHRAAIRRCAPFPTRRNGLRRGERSRTLRVHISRGSGYRRIRLYLRHEASDHESALTIATIWLGLDALLLAFLIRGARRRRSCWRAR